MLQEDKYFNSLTEAELWQRYCGFLDISVEQFMAIQEQLLLEEISLVSETVLGKKIMNNARPQSLAQFREMVPLTRYSDYEPYLSQRDENAIGFKPEHWCHTAGRAGNFKWVPHSKEFLDSAIKNYVAAFILASTKERGRVKVSPGVRLLSIVAPAPYSSGASFQAMRKRFSVRIIPPPEEIENMEFKDRIQKGFQMALKEGVDVIGTLASVLVRMGEAMGEQSKTTRLSSKMLHPKIACRFVVAMVRARLAHRSILPKDIWPTKAIAAGGLDSAIYRKEVAHYWGTEPYDLYACTETLLMGVQPWNRKYLTFLPNSVFLEFIPVDQTESTNNDNSVKTILTNELEEGKLYEVVITQLYGMPLMRYRLGDIIRVTTLNDSDTGIKLPQFEFQRRVDEVINLGGLAHLDEKTIWQAIAATGIKYVDWTARKEFKESKSYLRLYMELNENKPAEEIEKLIHEKLKVVDLDYQDVDSWLQLQPVKVTLLPKGTYQQFSAQKQKVGADIAHLKPKRINASDDDIELLTHFGGSTEAA